MNPIILFDRHVNFLVDVLNSSLEMISRQGSLSDAAAPGNRKKRNVVRIILQKSGSNFQIPVNFEWVCSIVPFSPFTNPVEKEIDKLQNIFKLRCWILKLNNSPVSTNCHQAVRTATVITPRKQFALNPSQLWWNQLMNRCSITELLLPVLNALILIFLSF